MLDGGIGGTPDVNSHAGAGAVAVPDAAGRGPPYAAGGISVIRKRRRHQSVGR
jgi:hypothetical protein